MEHFKTEIQQNAEVITSKTEGVFSIIKQCVNDFNQSKHTYVQDHKQDNFMINLTEFKQNLKYSPEYEEIFNSNDDEACNKSFNSTKSATEIENDLDMDIDVFENAEQLYQNDDADDLTFFTQEQKQIVPEFQLIDIKQQKTNRKDKISVKNENIKKVVEDLECKTCKETFTVIASLNRHYKTRKHQKKEMLQAGMLGQNIQAVYDSVQTQNYTQKPIINFVPKTIYQPRTLNLDQTKINFIRRLREARNQMIDQYRINVAKQQTFVENDTVPSPKECVQNVQIFPEIVNSEGTFSQVYRNLEVQNPPTSTNVNSEIVPTTQTSVKTSSQSATKAAIENSIKILSKLNTEASSKSPVTMKASPKKENSLKQMTLMEMAFTNPSEVAVESESNQFLSNEEPEFQQNYLSFEASLESFEPESVPVNIESELAKYIQLNPEDIEVEQEFNTASEEDQPQYEIVISEDSIFTLKELKVPEPTNKLMTHKKRQRQQRIQEDISSTSIKGHKCMYCTKIFSTTSNLRRHEHLHGAKKLHQCTVCGKEFMQKEYMKKHMTMHSRRFA